MTRTQQLEQPGGTREYIPRHAWVEPGEATAAQTSPPTHTSASNRPSPSSRPGTAVPNTVPTNDVLLYEASADDATAPVSAEPKRAPQPYHRVETSSDYVTIVPERKRLWRPRKMA